MKKILVSLMLLSLAKVYCSQQQQQPQVRFSTPPRQQRSLGSDISQKEGAKQEKRLQREFEKKRKNEKSNPSH